MSTSTSLDEAIESGSATDEQLAEWFGPDLLNKLAAQHRGFDESKRVFALWHQAVTLPIGLRAQDAFNLFIGNTSINDFVKQLDDDVLDTFVDRFPDLQAEYQRKLDQQQGI